MNILADECCPANVVAALRSDGHDVLYVAESAPSIKDINIIAWALREQRILITEDRDFCELVFVNRMHSYGIVLVRIPSGKRNEKVQRVCELFSQYGAQLPKAMTSLTLTNIRTRPLPVQ